MKFAPLVTSLALALVCLLMTPISTTAKPGDNDWKPVDPAHLALPAPVVEKDADAEAIFWEVRVDDAPEGDLIFTHYVRIKIFTERGCASSFQRVSTWTNFPTR